MDRNQQFWSFFWALVALFLAVAVLFFSGKSSRVSHVTTFQQPEESSAEQQSSLPMEYEVFLSFRGPDVRENFADFLHKYLDHSKIRTFIDEEDLRKGEDIAPSLVKAIQESKVYIPILSPDYASSKWCLKELALMLKCCNQSKGHILLPIFYMVEPRDVRHQQNSYKKAFQQHSKKHDPETINEWKEALEEVGKLKGWHVTKSDRQGVVVDQVFSRVWSHLTKDYLLVTDDLIGIDSHVEKVEELLQLGHEGVKIVGIHGMGGIGKTTIAKALYNKVHAQFDRYCFLEDVREIMSRADSIVTLQKKIVSSILLLDLMIKDANEGINIIRNRISKIKVLVILDDVDDRFKFDRVLGKLDEFWPGSRFIITTRDRRVMELLPRYELYEPELMSDDHSLELFSKHAFGMSYPPKEDVALAMKFVKAAAGLPLALKVIGSLLFRKDASFWNAKLEQLEDILPSEVQETLRISYLELTHEEKQVFLDIACFFIGKEKEQPFHMWSDCGFHPEVAISTLIQRSLVKVIQTYDRKGRWGDNINRMYEINYFWMHDHIRDLGRTITREEDLQQPWKRSRIWSNEDALDMLIDEKGTDRLEALRVTVEDKDFNLTDRQLEKLSGLRYLEVNNGGFTGNFQRILPNLRWLQLSFCRSLPTDLNVKKLVVLYMSNCLVTDDWRGWKALQAASKLRTVCFRLCEEATITPNLSRCGNLEVLNLEYCCFLGRKLCV